MSQLLQLRRNGGEKAKIPCADTASWGQPAAMKNIVFYSAFIRELQKIYARLALNILHIRMDRYHKQSYQRTNSNAHDIKLPLLECVNKIIDRVNTEPNVDPTRDPPVTASATPNPPVLENHQTINLPMMNNDTVGELSRYFKARSNGADLHPGIEGKLEHSTWEHIYAALRYARQGDNRNAKMHTNIASSACKELAHYMTEEQYQGFVAEIEKHLDALMHNDHSAHQG